MKKLQFDYYMQIDYTEEVATCNYTIKCVPQTNARQSIHDIKIEMSPPSIYHLGVDGLQNRQLYGCNSEPHKMFYFRIRGKADVGMSEYDELENDSLSMVFGHAHGLNMPGDAIKKYYSELNIDETLSSYDKALYIMEKLHSDYEYVPNTTDIDTCAEDAWIQGHGVCQDFAHIFISLMHLAKIPARYVTGLIVGEGASHAWVEILIDGKWYGLDPTNNKKVDDEHIKLGVGRDANDCMINRGIMHGGGKHTQTVKVNVEDIS